MKLKTTLLMLGVCGWILGAPGYSQDDAFSDHAIDFPGGTLVEYIDLIRETVPRFDNEGERQPANIFIADNARDLRVPPVQVTTNIDGALGILEMLSNDYQQVDVGPDPSGNITVISVDGKIPVTVEVINSKQLLNMIEKESLLSAIEIGLQMLGDDDGIEMKLHEESGLLFVKGVTQKTELVKQIINQLYDANPPTDMSRLLGGELDWPGGPGGGGGRRGGGLGLGGGAGSRGRTGGARGGLPGGGRGGSTGAGPGGRSGGRSSGPEKGKSGLGAGAGVSSGEQPDKAGKQVQKKKM